MQWQVGWGSLLKVHVEHFDGLIGDESMWVTFWKIVKGMEECGARRIWMV